MPYTIPSPGKVALISQNCTDDLNNLYTAFASVAGYDILNSAFAGGADPTGAANSQPAIQAALDACPLGGRVYSSKPGVFKTTTPITIPPQVTLDLGHSSHIDSSASCIKPASSFTGAAVILMVDQTTGGYAVESNQQRIRNVTIDCTSLTGSTIDGIQSQGKVHGAILEDIQVRKAPARGFAMVSNGSGPAYSWRGERLAAWQCGSHGFSVPTTDCTWIDCEAIGCGGNGFNLAGSAANTKFSSCRAEFCLNGVSLSSAWGTGQGSGGLVFDNLSTDRNTQHGVSVTATGTVPVLFNGLMCRRDGRNGNSGGGSFAGFSANGATIPIVVNGITVFPGVDDDGTGTNSPDNGLIVTSCSNVIVAAGFIQGQTSGIIDGGSNTNFFVGPQVISAHGSTSSVSLNAQPFLAVLNGKSLALQQAASAGQLLKVTGTTSTPSDSLAKIIANAAADNAFGIAVAADSFSRLKVDSNGKHSWGPGSGTQDTTLYRNASGQLKTDGSLVAASIAGGSFLCTPSSYAPGTQQTKSVSTTTIAAFDSTNIHTGNFTAPPSGSVLVTASFVMQQSASGSGVFGLCAHGTVTPLLSNEVQFRDSAASIPRAYKLDFLVSGLTPGNTYDLDLVGCQASGQTMSILAIGVTSTTPTLSLAASGAPVVMTVQAV